MSGIADILIKGKGITSPWSYLLDLYEQPPILMTENWIFQSRVSLDGGSMEHRYICISSRTFSVQVFELSSFSKAIYVIGVCGQARKFTHVFTSKSMPRQHILNSLVNWAPESEYWQMCLGERRCLVFYGKLWSKLPDITILKVQKFKDKMQIVMAHD